MPDEVVPPKTYGTPRYLRGIGDDVLAGDRPGAIAGAPPSRRGRIRLRARERAGECARERFGCGRRRRPTMPPVCRTAKVCWISWMRLTASMALIRRPSRVPCGSRSARPAPAARSSGLRRSRPRGAGVRSSRDRRIASVRPGSRRAPARGRRDRPRGSIDSSASIVAEACRAAAMARRVSVLVAVSPYSARARRARRSVVALSRMRAFARASSAPAMSCSVWRSLSRPASENGFGIMHLRGVGRAGRAGTTRPRLRCGRPSAAAGRR